MAARAGLPSQPDRRDRDGRRAAHACAPPRAAPEAAPPPGTERRARRKRCARPRLRLPCRAMAARGSRRRLRRMAAPEGPHVEADQSSSARGGFAAASATRTCRSDVRRAAREGALLVHALRRRQVVRDPRRPGRRTRTATSTSPAGRGPATHDGAAAAVPLRHAAERHGTRRAAHPPLPRGRQRHGAVVQRRTSSTTRTATASCSRSSAPCARTGS